LNKILEENMKITFEITKEDISNYLMYNSKKSKSEKAVRIIVYLFMLTTLLNSAFLFNRHMYGDKSYVTLALAILIALIMWSIAFKYRKMWLIRSEKKYLKMVNKPKYASVLGNKTIELREEGIYTQDANKEGFKKWSELFRMEESDNYSYVFTIYRSLYIIPHRTFTSDSEKNKFIQYIEQKIIENE